MEHTQPSLLDRIINGVTDFVNGVTKTAATVADVAAILKTPELQPGFIGPLTLQQTRQREALDPGFIGPLTPAQQALRTAAAQPTGALPTSMFLIIGVAIVGALLLFR